MSFTRRQFIHSTGACLLATQIAKPADSSELVGVQLYSIRNQLKTDLPGTLQSLAAFGIKQVETAGYYGRTATAFQSELARAGLSASSMHVGWDELGKHFAQVRSDAEILRAHYICCPDIPFSTRPDTQGVAMIVRTFSSWARDLERSGVRFAFHPESLQKWPSPEGTLLDTVILDTPPEVRFELDVFWTTLGQRNPAKLLLQYPKRFPLVHLKDFRIPVSPKIIEAGELGTASVALGKGSVQWPEFFVAARQIKVEKYFIESESPAAFVQLPTDLAFVKRCI